MIEGPQPVVEAKMVLALRSTLASVTRSDGKEESVSDEIRSTILPSAASSALMPIVVRETEGYRVSWMPAQDVWENYDPLARVLLALLTELETASGAAAKALKEKIVAVLKSIGEFGLPLCVVRAWDN